MEMCCDLGDESTGKCHPPPHPPKIGNFPWDYLQLGSDLSSLCNCLPLLVTAALQK